MGSNKTTWQVRDDKEDPPEQWEHVSAESAEDAAITFAHRRDSFCEYGRVIDRMTVAVLPGNWFTEERPEPQRFDVWGEIVPYYYATRVLKQQPVQEA